MKKRSFIAVLCISLICSLAPVMCVHASEPEEIPVLENVQNPDEPLNLDEIPVPGDDPDLEEDPDEKGNPTSGGNSSMNSTTGDTPAGSGEEATSSIISDGNMALMLCILVVAAGAVVILFTRKRKA